MPLFSGCSLLEFSVPVFTVDYFGIVCWEVKIQVLDILDPLRKPVLLGPCPALSGEEKEEFPSVGNVGLWGVDSPDSGLNRGRWQEAARASKGLILCLGAAREDS